MTSDFLERFPDRTEAGRALARQLSEYADQDCVVMALPRGGVPVGLEVANALSAPLELLLVRKIGAPNHPEYAIGAVVDGADPQVVMNEGLPPALAAPAGYVETEVQRLLEEIERRRQLYLGGRTPIPVAGKAVIVVDDGIATGATARVAIAALSRHKPSSVILAVPVAAEDALDKLRPAVDRILCLLMPSPFQSVGQHYLDFEQVSDQEVITALRSREADKTV
ncbi:phosphoribosyltransferase [Paracoccus beibuensis]|uniref:phosphoribosyltransferase n=1 Tax=Paracoccus beibuensis TaxID=547602 RepID=UPI00223EF10B|nr:phosphoribosyltransferase [Paracoccus beibuensis]